MNKWKQWPNNLTDMSLSDPCFVVVVVVVVVAPHIFNVGYIPNASLLGLSFSSGILLILALCLRDHRTGRCLTCQFGKLIH
jgi:hypothetical protein